VAHQHAGNNYKFMVKRNRSREECGGITGSSGTRRSEKFRAVSRI